MTPRLKRCYEELEKKGLDGLIISSQANITYLTGFLSRDAYLLISQEKNVFFTDARYTQEARRRVSQVTRIEKINGSTFFKLINASCRSLGLKHIGFEDNHFSFAEYKLIRKNLREGIRISPCRNIVEGLRRVKTQEEISKIRKAAQITILALKHIENFIAPGKTELDIAAELEGVIRHFGANRASFDIIVASGPNSSYPHHMTGKRKIAKRDLVLIDMGVEYEGYKSDLTRIFFLGRISPLTRKVYDIIRQAQDKAVAKIKPGIKAAEIDALCRQFIKNSGFGAHFLHSTGHGIGLEVHEAPRISSKDNKTILEGEVFTLEPGIYLTGKFGIRLEDMVLVTQKGCEVISDSLNK